LGKTSTSFKPGKSGNPNGRPKVAIDLRDLARQHGPACITLLAEMSGLLPGKPAEAEAARIAAIKEILDRGYGKATQPVSGDPDGPPIAVDFRWADATPPVITVETIEADDDAVVVVTFATNPPLISEC
jgi:hypothetical protein